MLGGSYINLCKGFSAHRLPSTDSPIWKSWNTQSCRILVQCVKPLLDCFYEMFLSGKSLLEECWKRNDSWQSCQNAQLATFANWKTWVPGVFSYQVWSNQTTRGIVKGLLLEVGIEKEDMAQSPISQQSSSESLANMFISFLRQIPSYANMDCKQLLNQPS